MRTTIHLKLLWLMIFLVPSCKLGHESSKTDNVAVALPDLADLPAASFAEIKAYQVIATPLMEDAACRRESLLAAYTGEKPLLPLSPGCVYDVVLTLGGVDMKGEVIAPVLYSSTNPATDTPLRVEMPRAEVAEAVPLVVTVYPVGGAAPKTYSAVKVPAEMVQDKIISELDVNSPLHPENFPKTEGAPKDNNQGEASCAQKATQTFAERVAPRLFICTDCHVRSKVLPLVLGQHEANYAALRAAMARDVLMQPFSGSHPGGRNDSLSLRRDFHAWQLQERACAPVAIESPRAP